MRKLIGQTASVAVGLKILTGAGIVRPYSPRALAGVLLSERRWGTGPAGGFAALAAHRAARRQHRRPGDRLVRPSPS